MKTFLSLLNTQTQLGNQWRLEQEQLLSSLPTRMQRLFLKTVSENSRKLSANPQAVHDLLKIMGLVNLNFTLSDQEHLATILLTHLDETPLEPARYAQLISRINRFMQHSDPRVLSLLAAKTLQNADTAKCYLADDALNYISRHVAIDEELEVQRPMDLFYQQSEKAYANPELIFDLHNPHLQQMFNFSQSSVMRNQRLMWMHALNHGAFIQTALNNEPVAWNFIKNNQLLALGFAEYVKHAQKVLAQPTDSLSRQQQQDLLSLSQELSIIGEPQLQRFNETPASLDSLRVGLDQVMGSYQSCLFKSHERKQQIMALQAEITQVTTIAGRTRNHYQDILKTIEAARKTAITADRQMNQDSRWLMQNRSGSSRYLTTLNTLQTMVIRHWVQDKHAVQTFRVYNNLIKEEFVELRQSFRQELALYLQRNFSDGEQTNWQKLTNRLFSHDVHKANLQQLLRDFLMTEVSGEQIKLICSSLAGRIESLPRHLQTLAKEVLYTGESLALCMEKESTEPVRQIIRS